jgi:hypothetical protein
MAVKRIKFSLLIQLEHARAADPSFMSCNGPLSWRTNAFGVSHMAMFSCCVQQHGSHDAVSSSRSTGEQIWMRFLSRQSQSPHLREIQSHLNTPSDSRARFVRLPRFDPQFAIVAPLHLKMRFQGEKLQHRAGERSSIPTKKNRGDIRRHRGQRSPQIFLMCGSPAMASISTFRPFRPYLPTKHTDTPWSLGGLSILSF